MSALPSWSPEGLGGAGPDVPVRGAGVELGEDHAVAHAWTCHHFSMSNPADDGAGDLPRLLRRVGEEIEARAIRAVDIQDITVSQQITGDGPWWSVTLYWSSDAGTAQ